MSPPPPRAARRPSGDDETRKAGWEAHLLRAEEQALDDLARTKSAEVVFVRHPRLTHADAYLDDLEERASSLGFVTAPVRVLADCAFDELHGLVAAVLRAVRPPAAGRAKRGIVALLDAFVASHAGRGALIELEARIEEEQLTGDLVTLAHAYVGAVSARRAEAGRIEAWLSGVELARAEPSASPMLALSARTAKRTLRDLTRLVRALGWRGTVISLRDADVIALLSPARRDAAYTVLRELTDNADGGRGLIAAQLVLAASTSFYIGPRSVASLSPLASRTLPVHDDAGSPPPPHRPLVDLIAPDGFSRNALPEVRPAVPEAAGALRAMVRAAHGLPPLEATPSMSVGHTRIDKAIDALFQHSDMDGSVFALLTGDYGAGKTHFLQHLTARALGAGRPVLRLSLERLDADLGHPERHAVRLLEQAMLPPEGAAGPLDRLARWTRSSAGFETLLDALQAIAAGDDETAHAAEKALARVAKAPSKERALAAYLGASELASKAPNVAVRRDAYGCVLLWLALLGRLDGCAGPVLLIDEAENLYCGGATRAERRTALRSLSFYCGGAIPRACVVLAITPDALALLQDEAPDLLDDIAEQRNVLAVEDASMFCRRLKRTRPLTVPALSRAQRVELAALVRRTHASARGAVDDPGWDMFVTRLHDGLAPREVVRRTVDRLDQVWWSVSARASDAALGRARRAAPTRGVETRRAR